MADDSPAKPLSVGAVGKLRRVVKTVLSEGGRRSLPWIPPAWRENRFRCKITGATQDGTNFKWDYTLRPQRQAANGAGWENDPAIESDIAGLNLVEENNTDTGIVSGYDMDADVNIIGIEPIPTGEYVDCWAEGYEWDGGEGGGPGYLIYFERDNKPIVECTAASSSI